MPYTHLNLCHRGKPQHGQGEWLSRGTKDQVSEGSDHKLWPRLAAVLFANRWEGVAQRVSGKGAGQGREGRGDEGGKHRATPEDSEQAGPCDASVLWGALPRGDWVATTMQWRSTAETAERGFLC